MKRATPIGLSALIGILFLSALAAGSLRAFEGANGRIAFQSRRDGNWEIYTMNADGSDVRRLTNESQKDERPGWSPDGSKLVFGSWRGGNADVYLMNADGSEVKRLTTHPGEDYAAQWSHDGRQIVFRSSRDGNREIYVMNADGSDQRNLTNHPAYDHGPVWSPNGDKIAFSSDRAGNDDIYVMNVDGSGVQQLTTNAAADFAAAWSPDGSQIAFRSERDGNIEIYIMNADGSDQHNVTRHPSADRGPAWSPDGTRLVFYSDRDGNYNIYTIRPDGSDPVRLTSHAADDNAPDWGPLADGPQPPAAPTNPSPANKATGVDLNTGLSWTAVVDPSGSPVTYDVYFGATNPPPFVSTQSRPVYGPGALTPWTTYYWRVVARNAGGATTTGPIWQFKTAFSEAPEIVSVLPATGKPGKVVTITGRNLLGATVSFNGAAATPILNLAARIRVKVPPDATTGPVTVMTPAGSAVSPTDFTVLPPTPALTGFSVPGAAAGETITLYGRHLAETTTVVFRPGVSTPPLSATDTEVRVIVPAGAASGKILVRTPGGRATSPVKFVVYQIR